MKATHLSSRAYMVVGGILAVIVVLVLVLRLYDARESFARQQAAMQAPCARAVVELNEAYDRNRFMQSPPITNYPMTPSLTAARQSYYFNFVLPELHLAYGDAIACESPERSDIRGQVLFETAWIMIDAGVIGVIDRGLSVDLAAAKMNEAGDLGFATRHRDKWAFLYGRLVANERRLGRVSNPEVFLAYRLTDAPTTPPPALPRPASPDPTP